MYQANMKLFIRYILLKIHAKYHVKEMFGFNSFSAEQYPYEEIQGTCSC